MSLIDTDYLNELKKKRRKSQKEIVHTRVSNQEHLDLKLLDEPLGYYTILTIFLI